MKRSLALLLPLALVACQDASQPVAPSEQVDAARASQAQDRLERATHAAAAVQGMVFVDDDERIGKLVIGVENASAARGVRTAMAAAGFAAGTYEVIEHAPIYQVATLRDKFDPTIAGIQIHFGQYVCTMGANVDDGTERSFITNSHCTNTQGGVEGTQYYQPTSSIDGTVIATEVEDPQYFKNGVCPRGKKCRYSDSSRAKYSNDRNSTRGAVAYTDGINTGSLTYAGTRYFTSQNNSTTNFTIGLVVNKVGRTTGWTRGEVTRTCVNTSVSGSQIMQLCQTFVSDPNGATVVSGGDSGSSVWEDKGSGNTALVGLLWGGSSDNKTFVFSPWKQVEQELGSLTATK
jgi:hypothetical protein